MNNPNQTRRAKRMLWTVVIVVVVLNALVAFLAFRKELSSEHTQPASSPPAGTQR
ncbi:MAG: hypothetical protein N3G20_04135 [Verrucomicrobiae bacterium]|nr:hypothetical protein [Verrucomicrobiae bacterium]